MEFWVGSTLLDQLQFRLALIMVSSAADHLTNVLDYFNESFACDLCHFSFIASSPRAFHFSAIIISSQDIAAFFNHFAFRHRIGSIFFVIFIFVILIIKYNSHLQRVSFLHYCCLMRRHQFIHPSSDNSILTSYAIMSEKS